MNTLSRDMKNIDGTIDTILISSNDNYSLDLNKTYKLANYASNKNRFKSSILGVDIGCKSRGFTTVTLLSMIIAIVSIVTLFFMWRV